MVHTFFVEIDVNVFTMHELQSQIIKYRFISLPDGSGYKKWFRNIVVDIAEPIYFVSLQELCYHFLFFFLEIISRVNFTSACLSKKSCFLVRTLENFSKYLASISPSRILVLDRADAAIS